MKNKLFLFINLFVCCFLVNPAGSIAESESPHSEPAYCRLPFIELQDGEENFFVLASRFDYKIETSGGFEDWLRIQKDSGQAGPHEALKVWCEAEWLSPGTHYGTITIKIQNPETAEFEGIIVLPAGLRSGESSADQFESGDNALKRNSPEVFHFFSEGEGFFTVQTMRTPGGHYIIEVTELKEKKDIRPQERKSTKDIYEIVFPWLCLEYCDLSRNQEVERQEVVQHLDAVNTVAYERYTMSYGSWGLLSVTNPTSWIQSNGLGSWPMVVGNSGTSSVTAMYNNRSTIASSMISAALSAGYTGYCIDVEGTADSGTRDMFIALVDYLADELHGSGIKLMVCHATWSTIAPIDHLAGTSIDYVATMDPYTNSVYWYQQYIPTNYAAIAHDRLIWGFCWEFHDYSSQHQQWSWMESNGYNSGVAGAAVWRTPCYDTNGINYYESFKIYYPISANPTPTATPGTGDIIIDNRDSGWYEEGNPDYWWYRTDLGWDGDMQWTYSNGSAESNWAKWTPNLAVSGTYQISVYIPNNYATSNAPYKIYRRGSLLGTVNVNQAAYFNQWVSLGNFYLYSGSGNYVRLSDATGEPVGDYWIGFDAVKFHLVAAQTPTKTPTRTPTDPPANTSTPTPTYTASCSPDPPDSHDGAFLLLDYPDHYAQVYDYLCDNQDADQWKIYAEGGGTVHALVQSPPERQYGVELYRPDGAWLSVSGDGDLSYSIPSGYPTGYYRLRIYTHIGGPGSPTDPYLLTVDTTSPPPTSTPTSAPTNPSTPTSTATVDPSQPIPATTPLSLIILASLITTLLHLTKSKRNRP